MLAQRIQPNPTPAQHTATTTLSITPPSSLWPSHLSSHHSIDAHHSPQTNSRHTLCTCTSASTLHGGGWFGRALTLLSTSSAGEPRAFRIPRHGSHATRINGLMATWVVGRTGRMGQWYGRVRGLLLLLPLETHGLRPQQRSLSPMIDTSHNTSTTLHVKTPSAAKPILPIQHQNHLHQTSQPLAPPGKSTLRCAEPTQRRPHPLPWHTKLIDAIQTILVVIHNMDTIKFFMTHKHFMGHNAHDTKPRATRCFLLV